MAAAVGPVPVRSYLGTPATAPGPSGPQMLAETMAIRRDPLGFLARMRGQHGDVVQLPIPRPPTYLVASAEGTRQVLVDNARAYSKDTIQYRTLALVTGDGLLTSAVAELVAARRQVHAPDPELLIDLFLNAGWTDREVRDQIVTFLVAGHETAASALTWALALLARDPAR